MNLGYNGVKEFFNKTSPSLSNRLEFSGGEIIIYYTQLVLLEIINAKIQFFNQNLEKKISGVIAKSMRRRIGPTCICL